MARAYGGPPVASVSPVGVGGRGAVPAARHISTARLARRDVAWDSPESGRVGFRIYPSQSPVEKHFVFVKVLPLTQPREIAHLERRFEGWSGCNDVSSPKTGMHT